MAPDLNRISGKALIALLICPIVLSGCGHNEVTTAVVRQPGMPVTVSPLMTGEMTSYIDLTATSAFLFKASIKSPSTGYVDAVRVTQGEAVQRNQTLYTIRTRESAAMRNDTLSDIDFTGIVNVKSSAPGLISSIEHPAGDYVAEGDQLCQVAVTESFAFILDVPFEQSHFIRADQPCLIILPDSQSISGIIKTSFPSMAATSQTQRFIVKMSGTHKLPENMTVRIRIVRESVRSAASLPKSCILTDETMQKFWVMKLINDTTAVKVPVNTGITENDNVQITGPAFDKSDLFLSSGNYGVGDTVNVRVIKNNGHEQ